MNTYEQSVMDRFCNDSTKVTFTKSKIKKTCTGLRKGQNSVFILGQGYFRVFSQEDGEVQCLLEHLVQFGQEEDTSPDDMTVADSSIE